MKNVGLAKWYKGSIIHHGGEDLLGAEKNLSAMNGRYFPC